MYKLPLLSLAEANKLNHRRLVDQLYLDWHGYYVVTHLVGGRYEHLASLSYDEALDWRNPDTSTYSLAVVLP